MKTRLRTTARGFSLVELLVAISIVALLVSMMLPAVAASRESARQAACANKLRQNGQAVQAHEAANRSFPHARNERHWSWLAKILPQMEEQPVYDMIDFRRRAWNADLEIDSDVPSFIMTNYLCPSDDSERVSASGPAYTNYHGVSGTRGGGSPSGYLGDGMYPSSGYENEVGPTLAMRHVTDGTSKTLLVGERPVPGVELSGGDVGWWAMGVGAGRAPYGRAEFILDMSNGLRRPIGSQPTLDDAMHWWSHHPAGAQFVFVDGHVRMMSYETDHQLLKAMATRNKED